MSIAGALSSIGSQLSAAQFGGAPHDAAPVSAPAATPASAGPVQGRGGTPVIPPFEAGAKFPLQDAARPDDSGGVDPNLGNHLPVVPGVPSPPPGDGPTIL
jgi:hypothetical protein